MFLYINKAGEEFQNAKYIYMGDFMAQEMVPDTYDHTKLFGLWKSKGSKLDLNMTRYIHNKKFQLSLGSEANSFLLGGK